MGSKAGKVPGWEFRDTGGGVQGTLDQKESGWVSQGRKNGLEDKKAKNTDHRGKWKNTRRDKKTK